MAWFEVFIPSLQPEQGRMDVTLTVEAQNWIGALRAGLANLGEGQEAIANVMCDIKEDKSIHVTDVSTRRVFRLREVPAGHVSDNAPTMNKAATPSPISLPEMAALRGFDDHEETIRDARRPVVAAPADADTATYAPPARAVAPPRKPTPSPLPTMDVSLAGAMPPPPPAIAPTLPAMPIPAQLPNMAVRAGGAPLSDETERLVMPPAARPASTLMMHASAISKESPNAPANAPAQPKAPVVAPMAPPRVATPPARTPTPIATKTVPPVATVPPQSVTAPPRVTTPPVAAPPAKAKPTTKPVKTTTAERGVPAPAPQRASGQFEQAPQPATRTETRSSPRTAENAIGRTDLPAKLDVTEAVADVFDATQELMTQRNISAAEIAERLLDIALQYVPAESATFYLADMNGYELTFAAVRGPKAAELKRQKLTVRVGQGIVGFSAQEGVCLLVNDIQKDPRYFSSIAQAIGYTPRDTVCASAEKDGRLFGAIQLINSKSSFDYGHMELLRYIGLTAASLLERAVAAQR
jgi:putative methionine-R-sulfoxide reductase with GAF domain